MESNSKTNSMQNIIRKIILGLTVVFLIGCSSLQTKTSRDWPDFDEFYIKRNVDTSNFYCYDSCIMLPQKITKQEYRILQTHLQNCYEKEE